MARISDILETFAPVLIQIATPHSTGTGFFLQEHNVIVTNEHVIRGNRRVVINGSGVNKQLVEVLYIDPKFDLAFLKAPSEPLPSVRLLEDEESLAEGAPIVAIGHPFGLKLSATNGIVSNLRHQMGDIRYIQHDAALNPGNSGGPLITMEGKIAGVNTFIMRDGNSIGFSLPASYLKLTIEEFEMGGSVHAARCYSCTNLVFQDTITDKYCPHCGAKIELPNQVEDYEPIGVNKTVEDMLSELGHPVELSRIGPHHWQIEQGSAKITLRYHDHTGLIIGDAFLAQLPKKTIAPIYKFLLEENHRLKHLSLSIRANDIILSLIIYDRYLNVETGKQMIQYLFTKADYYDNILVERYGAIWKEQI